MVKIYVDDMRPAPEGWTLCRDYKEMVRTLDALERQCVPVTHVSLDHDLHPEHYGVPQEVWRMDHSPVWTGTGVPTGRDCCLHILRLVADGSLDMPVITVHSSNRQGRANILELLASHGYLPGYLPESTQQGNHE